MKKFDSALSYRKIIVIGDILMMICSGFLYTWSVFVTPLESEMSWTRPETSMAYTIATTFNVLGSLAAALLNRKFSRKSIVQIAGLTTTAGFVLASRASQPWQLYLYYGVLMAASLGMVYNSILVTIVTWYREKPGTISGILLMCFGFAGILFNSIANSLIDAHGWRTTFVIFGLLFLVIFEIFAFCVKIPPKENNNDLPPALNNVKVASKKDASTVEMVHSFSFWLFALWIISIAAVGLTLSSHASPMAQNIHLSSASAAFLAGLVSVGSGCGRLLSGKIYDKRGIKSVFFSSLITILGGLNLLLAYSIQSAILLGISFFLIGMGFGGSPVCTTGFTKSNFGELNYGMNLSIATLPVLIASYVGPYLSGVIYQAAGYRYVCIAIIGYALLSLLFAALLQKQAA